jgi:hypothetical protein
MFWREIVEVSLYLDVADHAGHAVALADGEG